MSLVAINKFNRLLVDNRIELTLMEYIEEYYKVIHPKVDLKFIYYLMELSKKYNQFIISSITLQKYDIIDDIDVNLKIKKYMDKYGYQIGKHYKEINTTYIVYGKQVIKQEYMLTPHAFKVCLLHASNTNKYKNYYLTLENLYRSFSIYQMYINLN